MRLAQGGAHGVLRRLPGAGTSSAGDAGKRCGVLRGLSAHGPAEEHVVVLGDVVVAAEVALVDPVMRDGGDDVVVLELAGLVGQRVEGHDPLCQRVHSAVKMLPANGVRVFVMGL